MAFLSLPKFLQKLLIQMKNQFMSKAERRKSWIKLTNLLMKHLFHFPKTETRVLFH